MNAKCIICGNEKNFLAVHSYDSPDVYEAYVGIKKVSRCWVRCMRCGFYIQVRNYDLSRLEAIYKSGYRDVEFRGESIGDAFERIMAIKDSENERRYVWFATNILYNDNRRVLDIGSGIGVWPAILEKADFEVECVEENETSIDFIYKKLGMCCFSSIDSAIGKYDTVTMIHVLEHLQDPETLLAKVKDALRTGGHLFVEVPDSIEFSYLKKNHDEFNSCHVAFYNMSSLYRLLGSCGFNVVDMHLEKTKQRNLSRVMCLAINQ